MDVKVRPARQLLVQDGVEQYLGHEHPILHACLIEA